MEIRIVCSKCGKTVDAASYQKDRDTLIMLIDAKCQCADNKTKEPQHYDPGVE